MPNAAFDPSRCFLNGRWIPCFDLKHFFPVLFHPETRVWRAKKGLKESPRVGKIGAISSLEERLNLVSLITAAVAVSLVAVFAPGAEIKWWGIAFFVLVWLPMAHFGYGFYDALTVEKR